MVLTLWVLVRAFFAKLFEESLSFRPKQGTQSLWAQIQSRVCNCEAPASLPPSLPSPPNTCCRGWKPRVIERPLNSGPRLRLRPKPKPGTFHGDASLAGPEPWSIQLYWETEFLASSCLLSLLSHRGSSNEEVYCNSAFVLSRYSMAGDVSELGCEASWSEMQTSWNHEIMRPEGSSQEFRVPSNYFYLCSLFWAS